MIDLSQSANVVGPSPKLHKLSFECEFPRKDSIQEARFVRAKDNIVYLIEITVIPAEVICDIDFSGFQAGGERFSEPAAWESWEEVEADEGRRSLD